MARGVRGTAIQLLAAALLIIACILLPWATHKDLSTNVTTTFRGGPLSAVLLVCAAMSMSVSLLLVVRNSISLRRLHLVLGCAALIVSIALALSKISSANRVIVTRGGETAYAYGAGIAILASAVIAVTSFIALARIGTSEEDSNVARENPVAPSAR